MSNSCNIALHVYGMNAPKGYKFDLFYHQLSNSHLNTLPFYTARLDFNLITMKLIAVLFFAALAAAAPLDPAESKRHCWGLFLNCDYSDGSQCYKFGDTPTCPNNWGKGYVVNAACTVSGHYYDDEC
jgi:hypothetical protein